MNAETRLEQNKNETGFFKKSLKNSFGGSADRQKSHTRKSCNPLNMRAYSGWKVWRRVPESNRCTRICNPLRHHSANSPL